MSLFKNWILSLLCSFLSACCHREVGLEALSPCVSISEPASCLLLLLQMEGARGGGVQEGGQVLTLQAPELHLSSLGDGRRLSPCIGSRLYTQCLDVLGTLLCSASTKRTVLGPRRLQARPCQRVPSPMPFLLLHLTLTSELKGLGLFPLQP